MFWASEFHAESELLDDSMLVHLHPQVQALRLIRLQHLKVVSPSLGAKQLEVDTQQLSGQVPVQRT